LPVERVSCEEAIDFIGRLNAKTGKKYRLPTVEEWEYTFRCGNTTKEYMLSYSNDDENIGGKPYPVGMKQPNEWGIYDIDGNVIEWTIDPDDYVDMSYPVWSDGAWAYSRQCDTARFSLNFMFSYIDYKRLKESGYERMGFRLAHDSPITKPAWMYFSKVENPIKERRK
jgi:formylglycine-generating enzyme required for sulfatase activity